MREISSRAGYTREEEQAVHRAIEERFGEIGRVLREVVAPESSFRVDLCVVEPIAARPYYTIATCGMGARQMPVEPQGQSRTELVFMLPEDWDIDSRDERFYWPLRWLKLLARLPWEEESWLGWGHTVPNGEPFAENTRLSSILLLDAYEGAGDRNQGSGDGAFRLPDGQAVRFFQCFALCDEELDFQLEHGAQELLERLREAGALSPVLRVERESVVAGEAGVPEQRRERQEQPKRRMKPLLHGWQGPAGCLATDRITTEGAAVGYCYREAPAGDWDSGWRFTAGDESDDYMDDPRHSDVYTLNCVANYDVEILPILDTPAPCAFARGERGLERLKRLG